MENYTITLSEDKGLFNSPKYQLYFKAFGVKTSTTQSLYDSKDLIVKYTGNAHCLINMLWNVYGMNNLDACKAIKKDDNYNKLNS